jgi:hypothetical protein
MSHHLAGDHASPDHVRTLLDCAQACERLGDDDALRECAETCRRCAASCRSMAA